MAGIADALSNATSYQQGAVSMQQKTSAGIDQALSDYRERMARADTEEAALDPDALTPPTLTKPPQSQPTNPAQEWSSAAMWVAALSGIFTRQHATASLNAMAGVLNAYKSQDATAAQQAYDTWKVANENTIKSAKTTVDAYKSALAQVKTDRDAAKADVLAVAAALKDETIPYVMEHYGMDAVVRLVNEAQNHVDRMESAQPRIEEAQAKLQAQTKFITSSRALLAAQQSGDKKKIAAAQADLQEASTELSAFSSKPGGGGSGDWTPDAINLAATEYRLTGKLPALGMGSSDVRAKIIDTAATQMTQMGQKPEDIVALQAGTASDVGSLKNITRISDSASAYENTAVKNFDRALKLAQEGGIPTDMGPWFNQWIQTGETGSGDPNVPAYVAALLTGANEYAKVMSGSTGAQGSTVDSRREAAELLAPALDYDAIKNVIDNVVKPDMENKKASYRDMEAEIKGRISGAGAGTTTPTPPAKKPPPWTPAQRKQWEGDIKMIRRQQPSWRDDTEKAWVEDGGSAADFEKLWPK